MLLRQLEKSVEGDETAQNFVQMVACSERGEQVLEYLSNLLNLMLEEIESQCPFMRAKAGFLWVSEQVSDRFNPDFFFLFFSRQ